MDIKILGTRGEIPVSSPQHRRHSGLLIDRQLLFDLGEKDFLRYKPRAIFITHLHPDHAAFITQKFSLPSIPIYAPEKGRFSFITPARPLTIGRYHIRPISTHHSSKVKSCAYLIERGGTRLLYTGDLVWIDKKYRQRLGHLDCVITEASYLREGGLVRKAKNGRLYGHTGIPNLLRLFKPYTNKVILMHFGSWFFRNTNQARKQLAALAKRYDIELIAGHDGMTLKV